MGSPGSFPCIDSKGPAAKANSGRSSASANHVHRFRPVDGSGASVGSQTKPSQALRDSIELARRVDALGYTRYWIAEHHNMPGIASAAPEVLITHVAQVHLETSAGLLNPLDAIAAVCKHHGKTLIVDAMSSFGALPIDARYPDPGDALG